MIRRNKLKVGLIGAGHICPFHIQALKRVQTAELVGITDLVSENAERLAKQFRIGSVYQDVDQMLADVDVVHVLTPPASHASLVIRALERGCHVFVEKPLANCVEEYDAIIEASNRCGKTVGVDHSLLLDPFTLKAQQIIAAGMIGEVNSVQCIRAQDYPLYEGGEMPEMFRVGGFPFRDLGIHSLYQIEAFLGPIVDLKWMFEHRGNDPCLHFDEWQAMVRCERGSAVVQMSWQNRPPQDVLFVQGTCGSIRIDRFGLSTTVRRQLPLPEHPRRAINAVSESISTCMQVPWNLARMATKKLRRYHGLQEMVIDFYERLARNESALAGPEQAKRIGRWCETVAADADRQKEEYLQQHIQELSATTLITGATGRIGSQLLRRLLDRGERVRVLARKPLSQELRNHDQIEFVLGDLGDRDVVDRAVAGIKTVYHVGGVIHGEPADFVRGNVVGTENIVNSALRHAVDQFIYVSSLSVLQALRSEKTPIDEQGELELFPELRGMYTQTKLQAERVVTRAVHQFGLPAVILRPGEVIGEGGPLMSSGVGQRKGNWLIMFGDGSLEMPLIDVQDLVDAIVAAEREGIRDGSIIHLVDPDSTDQNEMARRYSEITGESLRTIHVPKIAIFAAAWCLEKTLKILGRRGSFSVYRFRSALAPRSYDVSIAKHRLGWTPRRGLSGGMIASLNAQEAVSDEDDAALVAPLTTTIVEEAYSATDA